jgi:hypothetical protein
MNRSFVDALEDRRLFAAGPQVTSQLVLGNDDAISGVVIGFDSQLDPASATNPEHYLFGGSRGSGRNVHKADILTPVYNDTDRTVTLTFTKQFAITRFKRLKIVVRGEPGRGVTDTSGNLLDGNRDGEAGGDSDTRYKLARGTKFSYKDGDGDKVSLRVRGARGRPMTVLFGPNRNAVQVWVTGTGNRLQGEVRQRRTSLGVAHIARVVLEDPTNTSELLSPSPFNVGQTVVAGSEPVLPNYPTLP